MLVKLQNVKNRSWRSHVLITPLSCQLVVGAIFLQTHALSTLKLPCVAVKYYSHIERTPFYLCKMNGCASQTFWSISSPFIRDQSRFLLNFNGSHKVSVIAQRLLLSPANCRQNCIILYFHHCSTPM